MNLFLRIVVIGLLASVCQYYLPWWTSILVALGVELVLGKAGKDAFFSGFYGISIPWMILAAYIDIKSDSVLTVRILQLFKLPQFSIILIILTGLLGGISGGVGSLTGGWLKALVKKDGV